VRGLKLIPLGYILAVVFGAFLVLAELLKIEAGQRMAGELYLFSMKMVLLIGVRAHC